MSAFLVAHVTFREGPTFGGLGTRVRRQCRFDCAQTRWQVRGGVAVQVESRRSKGIRFLRPEWLSTSIPRWTT